MNTYLSFSTSTELVRLPSDAVAFVTADGNYSAITTADGEEYVLTMQLCQIERRIAEMVESNDHRFVRIGKSLIINREYITLINPARQKLILSDCRAFRHEVTASREALKALKDYMEKEAMK